MLFAQAVAIALVHLLYTEMDNFDSIGLDYSQLHIAADLLRKLVGELHKFRCRRD